MVKAVEQGSNDSMQKEVLCFADNDMSDALKELWQEAFGDDRAYIDFFFANRFRTDETVVCLWKGEVVSMATFMPIQLYCGDKPDSKGISQIGARYVYAVATKKPFRKKGYAAQIIKFAADKFRQPLILVPADGTLCEYYKKLGFCEAFSLLEYRSDMQALNNAGIEVHDDLQLFPIEASEYKKIRDRYFKQTGYVEWDEKAIDYALKENAFCGGSAYKVYTHGIEGFFMYRSDKKMIHVLETTLADTIVNACLIKLGESSKKVMVRRQVTDFCDSRQRQFGMIYIDHKTVSLNIGTDSIKNGYLNLVLE